MADDELLGGPDADQSTDVERAQAIIDRTSDLRDD